MAEDDIQLDDEDSIIFEAEHLPAFARTYALPRKMKRRPSLDQTKENDVHGGFSRVVK